MKGLGIRAPDAKNLCMLAWLVREQNALGQRRPLDVLEEPDGVERLATLLQQIEFGEYV